MSRLRAPTGTQRKEPRDGREGVLGLGFRVQGLGFMAERGCWIGYAYEYTKLGYYPNFFCKKVVPVS